MTVMTVMTPRNQFELFLVSVMTRKLVLSGQ
jgi:hypothetical protein